MIRCEHGHSYVQGDIVDPNIKGPACPECRKGNLIMDENALRYPGMYTPPREQIEQVIHDRRSALDRMAEQAIWLCQSKDIPITKLVLIEERLDAVTRWRFEILE